MKKFIWPLQRLLDVKKKQEDATQTELVALLEQSTAIRGRIMMQKILIRNLLRNLQNVNPEQRLEQQNMFMQHIHIEDMKIDELNKELKSIEIKRREKMEQRMSLRKFRKGLERLRDKALSEYHLHMNREEQKLLDESTHITFSRKHLLSC